MSLDMYLSSSTFARMFPPSCSYAQSTCRPQFSSTECTFGHKCGACSRKGQIGHVRKNCLLPPLSSIISIRPGFSCSIEGTWFAKTPISPVSAARLTWTLNSYFHQYYDSSKYSIVSRSDKRVDVHILGLKNGLYTQSVSIKSNPSKTL